VSTQESKLPQPDPAATATPAAGTELNLTVTAAAIKKLRAFQAENAEFAGQSFRVYVQGGGCSGFSYGFAFDQPTADDFIWNADGFPIACDPLSAQYLRGATVDYVEDLQSSGFVVKNPNARGSCGCGSSFQV
jgi:iron-sulfur cluster insertion protein